MITDRIKEMLESCQEGEPPFPPNILFNESWLLRIIVDWFQRRGGERYPLSRQAGARWFSEAWLPSAFLARYRGDLLSEARTQADGVIGHFQIGEPGTARLALRPDATQLVVIEAKLYNRLTAGVRNSPDYDQAARTVACIAETLRRADRPAQYVEELAFLLIAPQSRIDDGIFEWETSVSSIRRKVSLRVEDYGGERDAWMVDWFEPTLDHLAVRCLSWEDIIDVIAFHEPEVGQHIDSFYGECLRFNNPRARQRFPGRQRLIS